ncbi:inositol-3-phosphate synthase [Melittangium boletus]|uniref:Inositol-3-phosphate synthase n=1 Tax=Melittangium boletus DSM 14713 TaxID=1294270 RepID=A0A250I9N1_9BACT|nr:inositol-3-phosphate synthase [Melittangium boletus]ATB28584.1 inositol-3-phosphate synthase [Melittangium boletus DSM 14713]
MAGTERLGVALVGLGGAVATTAVAGMELLKRGLTDTKGLPLAGMHGLGLIDYGDLVFGGWDLYDDDLAKAARNHSVLSDTQLAAVSPILGKMKPWPASSNTDFCKNVVGSSTKRAKGLRDQVNGIRDDLEHFKKEQRLNRVVVINVASTERPVNLSLPQFATPEAFEAALDANDPNISPAMLYAYAAVSKGIPFANFTPSVAADVPALLELARRNGSPVAGKDGKTGQTLLKTVLAPALRDRALYVDGWYSTNILGNRDGEALNDPASKASKIDTKGAVLDSILGYKVQDHIVQIQYYRPRGDNKEAWDNIDVIGFCGQPMQLKINFLCKDSILAAPLVVELARTLDLAKRRGESGVIEELGCFFKAPMTRHGGTPEHSVPEQQRRLMGWLGKEGTQATGGTERVRG